MSLANLDSLQSHFLCLVARESKALLDGIEGSGVVSLRGKGFLGDLGGYGVLHRGVGVLHGGVGVFIFKGNLGISLVEFSSDFSIVFFSG